MSMTSSRPYMVRAVYEWVSDNDCTPYILVNAEMEGVQVPEQYIQDGQIILNISSSAVVGLNISNDYLTFKGRFGGVAQSISVPVAAVLGIYARENGQGMLFDSEDPPPPMPPSPGGDDGTPPRPKLKVVK
ncbi:ClpXP protease specificity-enhancing factor [Spongiibacter taiwanensis]|uniref:ClpXP protease specificity-enhancing factor n=1 Tax=Spongiibacter taiwanensis TaxID=1748242 RepID=UPI002035223B|nr:ClpXP protease specificity-enhancing factor [Spongiibacter taiwanensis]USA44289.1 ClpXP protease specificity-enhancing factor [Spongiibacter taiwanensis]